MPPKSVLLFRWWFSFSYYVSEVITAEWAMRCLKTHQMNWRIRRSFRDHCLVTMFHPPIFNSYCVPQVPSDMPLFIRMFTSMYISIKANAQMKLRLIVMSLQVILFDFLSELLWWLACLSRRCSQRVHICLILEEKENKENRVTLSCVAAMEKLSRLEFMRKQHYGSIYKSLEILSVVEIAVRDAL